MTKVDSFKSNYHEKLNEFLKSDVGIALCDALKECRPGVEKNKDIHLYSHSVGKKEGYENCMFVLGYLSLPIVKNSEIEPDYGVKQK